MNGIYVASIGNNKNNGSFEAPFKTIQKAIDSVNNKDKSVIYIRGGVYEVDKTINITDIDNLEIKAYNNENVRLVGGKVIEHSKINKVTDKNILDKLLNDVKDSVYSYDFGKDNITVQKKFFARYNEETVVPAEFFINGEAGRITEYPRNSWIPIKKIIEPGESFIDGEGTDRQGGTFVVEDERAKYWKNCKNALLMGFVGRGYACETLPVEQIDTEKLTLKLVENGHFGLNLGDSKRDFKILNLMEELMYDGEYYVDEEARILYFCCPDGYSEETEFVFSTLNEPVIQILNCTNVKISGLTVEMGCANGIQIYSGENNIISDCTLKNFGKKGVCIGRHVLYESVPLTTSKKSFYEYEEGLINRRVYLAGKNQKIENCHIYDCGSGAIFISGGYRPTLISGNNEVINCNLHDCNRWMKTGCTLIALYGVGNRIANCELWGSTAGAIWLHGNEHIIEYNDFHNLCTDIDDGGAFYMGRDPSEQGNIVRFNYFHKIESRRDIKVPIKDGFGVFSVYIDDGGSGASIYGNVFYQGGNWAIANNGGSDIKVENNIIIESENCIWHTDNQVGRYSNDNMPTPEPLPNGHSHLYYFRLLDDINILKSPYCEKYPQLLNLFNEAGYPMRNTAVNNVVYHCLNFITTWHQKDQLLVNSHYLQKDGETISDVLRKYPVWYEQRNNIISSELSFLDNFENVDFDIVNAEIKKLIPDFSDIPFDKIGVGGRNE